MFGVANRAEEPTEAPSDAATAVVSRDVKSASRRRTDRHSDAPSALLVSSRPRNVCSAWLRHRSASKKIATAALHLVAAFMLEIGSACDTTDAITPAIKTSGTSAATC